MNQEDVSQKIYKLNPSKYPLYAWLKSHAKTNVKECNNPHLSWFIWKDSFHINKRIENLLTIKKTEFNIYEN